MSDALTKRLDALEARVAYQDDTIETLNKTITAQWSEIDGLNRRVAELRERLAEAESRSVTTPSSEKPPHY
ncbi:MAG: SlyX family protein [Rhizobiales bacterium]|nr:SlyX family protein [Hyphomicrobiales bacterium]